MCIAYQIVAIEMFLLSMCLVSNAAIDIKYDLSETSVTAAEY